MSIIQNAIAQVIAGLSRDKFYVLQHAHCEHIAGVFLDRADAIEKRAAAERRRMYAWRVRLLTKGADTKGSCKKCEADLKALRPKRRQKVAT